MADSPEVPAFARARGDEPVVWQVLDRPIDRLGHLISLEQSVVEAKRALGEAEAAMRSVHSGLALEPMPELAAPLQTEAAPQEEAALREAPARVFDPVQHYRRLAWSQVPMAVQAAGLVLAGWCIAMAAVPFVGAERAQRWAADVRGAVAMVVVVGGESFSFSSDRRSSVAVGMTKDKQEASDEAAVVIYERTSPYPDFFAGLASKERYCLAEAIYYESRGEPVVGQIAVAQVVLNRTLAGSWPRTVCAVTHQGVENGEKCQFSYACQRSILTAPNGDPWVNAQALAEEILQGGAWLEEMLDATHFHRSDLKPVWRASLVEIGRFGRHTFYSSPTENRRPLSRVAVR